MIAVQPALSIRYRLLPHCRRLRCQEVNASPPPAGVVVRRASDFGVISVPIDHQSHDHGETAAPAQPDPPLIEVTNLNVRFDGGVEALRGVTLTLGRGESLAVVGESGSGKSTLA